MVEFLLWARIWRDYFYREDKVRFLETKEETNKVRVSCVEGIKVTFFN
jgi:hypothetical protein